MICSVSVVGGLLKMSLQQILNKELFLCFVLIDADSEMGRATKIKYRNHDVCLMTGC